LKNKLKKSTAPDQPPVRRGKLLLHIFRLAGFALALFALLTVGLPPNTIRHITAQLHEAGIPLQVKSIRLSMHHGWQLNDARLYSTSPDDLQPLLEVKKLYVMPWPVDWKNLVTGGWHINVYAKRLGVSLGRPWEDALPKSHPFRTISQLKASLTAAPGRVDLESSDLQWGNIRLLTHGTARFSAVKNESQSRQSKDFRRRAAKAADALSLLKCEKFPHLNLTFNLNEAHPEENSLEAILTAEGIVWQNRVYERLSGMLEYRDSSWTVPVLQLNRSQQEQLILHGKINFETGIAQASVENTLSAADLFSLLPDEAQSAVAQTGIQPYGRFDFTASAGPAPAEQLAEKITVQIQQAQFKRKDITVDSLTLRLTRDGNRVEVSDMHAVVNNGPLSGNLKLDLDSKTWIARMKTQCDPLIAGEYDKDLQDFLQRFDFPVELPKTDLALSQAGPDQPVVMNGTISANRFLCGGVPIDHLETSLIYSNQVVDLTPIHAVRMNEQFDGSVQVDFNRQLGIFNATNSFPPADIARALAPDNHTLLELFRFDGPVYAAGHGQIDYGGWIHHALKGVFRAENAGINKLQVSLFSADIEMRGTQLLFTNASARIYDGLAKGSAEFDISLEDGSAPCHIKARLSQINLEKMLGQVSAGGYNRTRGLLSTSFELSADAKAGFWKSVLGSGQIKIENGRLADVPLFGGFSRLIQSAFAGFNLFSLTTFSADYTLHDGAIWSDNAQLGGTLFSTRARGNYSPENGLNFAVIAEPFRQSNSDDKEWYQLQRWAADAVKEGTAPLFRLLEFQLDGPLDKPQWRFVNLPKDVSELLRSSK